MVPFVARLCLSLMHHPTAKFAQRPAASPAVRAFATAPGAAGDVVVPELVDTLEWVIESPPNVHQFDEPPLIVEIEHLNAMKFEEI